MVFASYEFIYLFLPIVLIVYFTLSKYFSKNIQHIFLILASLFFYAYFNSIYLLIIIASILVNYSIAGLLVSNEKDRYHKYILTLGIIFNIAMLAYFKYYDFFVSNINVLFSSNLILKNILLPLGISFFTFQQLSFLISVYKSDNRTDNFVDYCLFVTFFPQLVAGPIVLYDEMMPQFAESDRRFIDYDNFAKGIFIFSIGLFKKIVIADTVALFVNNGFALTNPSLSVAWITAISYTIQIYFDFSGYSDMAIGIGKMFNIDLPLNFNSPYKSKSVTEFWKRWHITLGRALSTYVYIPLGGNRKGLKNTCINLLITFLISGLWHGAAWTFILWGVLNGVIISFEKILSNSLNKIPGVLRNISTFLTINFLWVLFRASNFQNAIEIYKGMLNFRDINIKSISILTVDGIVGIPTSIAIIYVASIILILLLIQFRCKNTLEIAMDMKFDYRMMMFSSILFVISTIHLSRLSTFIYFNF